MKRSIFFCFTFLFLFLGNLNANNRVFATVETNIGDFKMELYPENAPKTVANFRKLAKENFYSDIYFHRVFPDYFVQAGCPLTKEDTLRANDGKGHAGYFIKNEINPKSFGYDTLLVKNSVFHLEVPVGVGIQDSTVQTYLESKNFSFTDSLKSLPHIYGAVSMASINAGKFSSQFFIVTREEGIPHYNGKNTVFGEIVEGMNIIRKIEELPLDDNNNPLKENQAVIKDISIKTE